MKNVALIALLILVASLQAKENVYNNPYIIWKDADILIWTPDSNLAITPKEFCLALKRNNNSIGEPKCRIFGEWERDSLPSLYSKWLQKNLDRRISPEHLRARNQEMIQKLNDLEDKTVIYITRKKEDLYIAIFEEMSATPKAVGIVPYSDNPIKLSESIAQAFFTKKAERRLTKDERRKKNEEPDPYYLEVPKNHSWVGVSYGKTQASLPLTPKSWYKNKINSKIKNYRNTNDSLSLWNFIEDESPLTTIFLGRTWYGFIGAELFYRYSSHRAKIDPADTLYQELDHWRFKRHEIGVSLVLSRTYNPTSFLEAIPYGFLGFQYSFFEEDIALKKGLEPSRQYKSRIEFESAYKGALFGIGTHLVFYKNYGINFTSGIGSRGRMLDSDPNSESASEPTIIGGSTIDCFVSVGIEYHWRLK